MAVSDDRTLDVLIANGLMSLIWADDALLVVSCRGEAAADILPGASLCEQVPALFGLEEQIHSLKMFVGRRVEMTNMGVIGADGSGGKRDYVVIYDHAQGGFLLSITPSLSNNALAISLEQKLRTHYQLEKQVAAQARAIDAANEMLRQTNADLMEFTRIIAHDLKAPMRAIRYSAEDLEVSLGDVRDESQQKSLSRLQAQSRRMSRMVSDLLAYSRLDDKTAAVETVDTRNLVEEIVTLLPCPETLQVEIVGDWPRIETIATLLDLVVRNVVDNAIKHHDTGSGQIILLAERIGGMLEIVVVDDGPGIPPDYLEAVIRPFVKVDRDATESSGLGLSMVERILSNVGGRLNVGQRVDGRKGARVAVSWPLTIEAQ